VRDCGTCEKPATRKIIANDARYAVPEPSEQNVIAFACDWHWPAALQAEHARGVEAISLELSDSDQVP